MKMTNTTFKTEYDIPMDKITYDNITRSRHDLITRDLTDDIPPIHIEYDEDLQIATFNNYHGLPFWLEQTSCYIIIIINKYDVFPQYYFINKKTGEYSRHKPDSIIPYQLVDGLQRVYNRSENELLEIDFISDKLKEKIKWERMLREYEDAERDAERDADDEFLN